MNRFIGEVTVSLMGKKGASFKGSVIYKQIWNEVHYFVKHIIL